MSKLILPTKHWTNKFPIGSPSPVPNASDHDLIEIEI